MKHLIDYITEALLVEGEDTKVDKDALLDALNDHSGDLTEFVKALNTALKNAGEGDNAKLWIGAIKDLFDGENGEAYKAKNHVAVEVSKLFPTQSEIDIEKSAKWAQGAKFAKGVADMFSGEAFGKSFSVPVLVYVADGKNWIIDGHHRWSQVGLLNPEASIDCMVVTGPETVQDFLKITQGAIAAVIADDENKNNGKKNSHQLPIGSAVPENNIFGKDLEGDKLTEKIVKMFDGHDDCVKIVVEALQKNGHEDIKDAQGIAQLATKNRDLMIENKQVPQKWAAPRPVMPQSDAAGPNDPENADDGNPDNEGSALYAILHRGKFPNIGK